MEANEQKKIASNGGYSLVELIVTVLISGVVMLAVMGFLTSGLNHYRNVNSETLLQMESQMTELFLTELMQEATDFQAVSGSDLPSGVTAALEVKKGADVYMVALIGNELRYSAVDASKTTAERVAQLAGMNRKDTFLSQYVTSFSLTGAQNFEDAKDGVASYAGTMINIGYQVDQKTYSSSSLIMLRNVERN